MALMASASLPISPGTDVIFLNGHNNRKAFRIYSCETPAKVMDLLWNI